MKATRDSVLIVDDDQASRAILRHVLESRGIAVSDAGDGQQALDRLHKHSFDLILLDIVMPGISGLEVLRDIRQRHSLADLPVIMATANDQPSDIVGALKLGANDYVTRPFDFPVLLARVQTQLALRRCTAELQQANRRMRADLEAAVRVQTSLLPNALPQVPSASFAWHYEPCVELAGDLLNIIALDERHIALYVLEVVGKGAAAALLAVMVHRVLARLMSQGEKARPTPPAEVAARLNAEFPWNDQTQQFFTLLYGIFDLEEGNFHFVSAGHPGPIHLPTAGEAHTIKVAGQPIGLGDEQYEELTVHLDPGDRLYLYSDGLTDAFDRERKSFGDARLRRVLSERRDVSLADGVLQLIGEVKAWCAPAEPHDDISVLAVERLRDAT